jgi:cytochrome c553
MRPPIRALLPVLLWLGMGPTPAWALAPQDDDEDDLSNLPSGVLAAYQPLSGGGAISRLEPVPRLFGVPGDAPEPSVRGSFEVNWSGKLIAPEGTYTFFLEPCSLAEVTFTLDGKAVLPGRPVRLGFGLHPFALRGVHRGGIPALTLHWESSRFVREAVPPRAFVHEVAVEPTDALRRQAAADRGAVLAEWLGCVRCHEVPKVWPAAANSVVTDEHRMPGPRLDGGAGRLHPGWVDRWLKDPQAMQPEARMPLLFGDTPADREVRETITAYLTGGRHSGDEGSRPRGDAGRGKKLFAAAGCAACHEPPAKVQARPLAPALTGLAAKWTAAGLADFLRAPLTSRPHGRMPDFGFAAGEAADLAAFLLGREKLGSPLSAPPPPSLEQLRRQWVALGEDPVQFAALKPDLQLRTVALRLMRERGCMNCHAIDNGSVMPPRSGRLAGLPADKRSAGCLSTDGNRGRAPRWTLSAADRAALETWMARLRRDAAPSLAEAVRLEMHLFNCAACHRNEGQGGEALVEVLGGPSAAKWRTPPDLTGVAGRLREDSLVAYLRHGARRPLRPWLGAHMPGFGERGARLALGLVARDLSTPKDIQAWWREVQRPAPAPAPPPPNHVELARYLVSARGLACANCHAIKGHSAGEIADPTTRGPDLARVAAHLRPEHFRRLLHDPARIFPGTTMPQAIPPSGPLLLPGFEKLSAAVPLEALWGYLGLGEAMPPPLPADAGTATPTRTSGPVVQRGPTRIGERVFGRGIALGFADGTLLFDADSLRPAAFWTGGFLASSLDKYFGYSWRPAAEAELLDATTPHLVFRLAGETAWRAGPLPADTDPNSGSRFGGYTVGRSDITFRYRLLVGGEQVAVSETLRVDRREVWRGFLREIEIGGLPGGSRVALAVPNHKDRRLLTAAGTQAASAQKASLVVYPAAARTHAVRIDANSGAAWEVNGDKLVAVLPSGRTAKLRADWWVFTGDSPPTPGQLASLCAAESSVAAAVEPAAPPPPPRKATPAAPAGPFTYRIEPIAGPATGWRPSGTAVAADGTVYTLDMPNGRVYRACFADFPSPHWQLYGSGLNQPLGIAVLDGRLFVAQRPEITELIAHDPNWPADEYRSVTGGPWPLGGGYHEYTFGIAVGDDRRLYAGLNCGFFWPYGGATQRGRFKGSFLRIEPSGKVEEFARGARVPNGLCRGPDGEIYFCDNQGDWIPVCKLAALRKGRFYGHPESERDVLPAGQPPDGAAACWLPYEHCRSASGPVYDDTAGRFGPFAGQFFLGDVGYGANKGILRVALEKVGGEYQGACFRFLDDEPLGVQHLTFGPDGQMLASCLTSGLVCVRFGGQTPLEIHHIAIRPGGKGFVVHFTKPLAADLAVTATDFQARRWHYRYSKDYGSPKMEEHEAAITGAELSADRRSVTLTLPVESYPGGMVYYLHAGPLRAGDGTVLAHREAWYTVQRVPPQ